MPSNLYTGAELKRMARKSGKAGMIGGAHASSWLKAIRMKYGHVADTAKYYSRGKTKGVSRSKELRGHRGLPDVAKYEASRDAKRTSGVMKKGADFAIMGSTIVNCARQGTSLAGGISAVQAFREIQSRYGTVEPNIAYVYVWSPRWRKHIWIKATALKPALRRVNKTIKSGRKGARGRRDASHKTDTRRKHAGRTRLGAV